MSDRPLKDAQYKFWRIAVFKRDGFACKKCGLKDCLEAHHIKRWAEFPMLRYVVSNGITLCKRCHDLVWGKEEEWEAFFTALLPNKSSLANILWELNNVTEE